MKKAGYPVLIILFSLMMISYTGCKELGTWEVQERMQIDDFLKKHDGGDTIFVSKTSGLYFAVLNEGTGSTPVDKDTVEFFYKGMFLDGVVFDSIPSDSGSPLRYLVGSGAAIDGIDEGVRYMQQGGKYLLLTPSSLAFGSAGVWGLIPGYTPLIWEVEMDSVIAGPARKR